MDLSAKTKKKLASKSVVNFDSFNPINHTDEFDTQQDSESVYETPMKKKKPTLAPKKRVAFSPETSTTDNEEYSSQPPSTRIKPRSKRSLSQQPSQMHTPQLQPSHPSHSQFQQSIDVHSQVLGAPRLRVDDIRSRTTDSRSTNHHSQANRNTTLQPERRAPQKPKTGFHISAENMLQPRVGGNSFAITPVDVGTTSTSKSGFLMSNTMPVLDY